MSNKQLGFVLNQPARYLINGLMATAVHFCVLTFNLKLLAFSSAGFANMIAAVFGIGASFIGSRYFVFKHSTEPLFSQMYRFVFLYAAIALLHGFILYLWVDKYSMSYVTGFGVATVIQVLSSYIGNKIMVFKV